METVISQEANVTVISITGRLDAVSAPELEGRIGEWMEQNGTALVMDLERLDYISSAGLRIVLATAKKMKARNGKFCLAGLRGGVKEVFEISGFGSIIPVFENRQAALDAAK
jgi:anti-anti-sigma factor